MSAESKMLTDEVMLMLDRYKKILHLEKCMAAHKLKYREFEIVMKLDFGDEFHLIDGMPCNQGYIVCYGPTQKYAKCNAMPGATWFQTVKQAKRAIDVLIQVGGEGKAEAFWKLLGNQH